MKFYYVYILLCSDNSYYTGMTNDLDRRITQHKTKRSRDSYTASRLPIILVWYLQCTNPTEAIKIEKQIKGWTKKKKKALIDEKWQDLIEFSKNYTEYGHPSKRDQSSTNSD
ncbi:GIY-YIG nuclease family protein [Lacinutrix chionoecetis]